MFKSSIVALFLLLASVLSGQTAISGYIELANENESSKEVQLTKVKIENVLGNIETKEIALTKIKKNGFFKFDSNLISNKDAMYRLRFNRFDKTVNDTIQLDHLFLLSNKDSIYFKKSERPFSEYTNTNLADKEWQQLRKFEQQLQKTHYKNEGSLSDAYVGDLKTYAKDSLQILVVKLIGIKQLDNRNLLDKDIAKNPSYYTTLLTELKESDIEPSEYLFLENKLAFLTTEAAENKYAASRIINILLVLAILGLVVFILWLQNNGKSPVVSDLSKREKNIKKLILQGKSNKEIANELFISLSTVKTHITNIYNKLQVSNRQELFRKTQNS